MYEMHYLLGNDFYDLAEHNDNRRNAWFRVRISESKNGRMDASLLRENRLKKAAKLQRLAHDQAIYASRGCKCFYWLMSF